MNLKSRFPILGDYQAVLLISCLVGCSSTGETDGFVQPDGTGTATIPGPGGTAGAGGSGGRPAAAGLGGESSAGAGDGVGGSDDSDDSEGGAGGEGEDDPEAEGGAGGEDDDAEGGTGGIGGSDDDDAEGGSGGDDGPDEGEGGSGGDPADPPPIDPPGEQPNVGPAACGCETPGAEFGTVNETIVVGAGETYDGQCKIFRANPSTLGDGDQGEDQKPVFRINNGGTLRNVVLGASAADGVHTYGDVNLQNIHWLDIGEDAMTVKESGTVNLNCGSAKLGSDKVFQVNDASEIHITNFTARTAGKFMRQNGSTTFKVDVYIDHCDISDMKEVIFRTDSGSSHVTLTNTRHSALGDGLFMFGDNVVNGNSGQSAVENNQAY